ALELDARGLVLDGLDGEAARADAEQARQHVGAALGGAVDPGASGADRAAFADLDLVGRVRVAHGDARVGADAARHAEKGVGSDAVEAPAHGAAGGDAPRHAALRPQHLLDAAHDLLGAGFLLEVAVGLRAQL